MGYAGRPPMMLTYKGETLPLAQWAKRVGLSEKTLRGRVNAGWPIAEALGYKPHSGARNVPSKLSRTKKDTGACNGCRFHKPCGGVMICDLLSCTGILRGTVGEDGRYRTPDPKDCPCHTRDGSEREYALLCFRQMYAANADDRYAWQARERAAEKASRGSLKSNTWDRGPAPVKKKAPEKPPREYKTTEAERARAKAYRDAHREEINRKARERYAADPEAGREKSRQKYAANREKKLEYQREYNEKNKDAIRVRRKEYDREYYLANKEKRYAYHKQWKKDHPEKVAQYDRDYRARKKAKEHEEKQKAGSAGAGVSGPGTGTKTGTKTGSAYR